MLPEKDAKLRKIRRISVILRVMCGALLLLIVIGFLMAMLALLGNRGGSIGYFDVWFRITDLTAVHRWVVLMLGALTSAVWAACIYRLYQLFGNYSRGEIFTRSSVLHLRQIGVACMLWGVMKIAWTDLPRAFSGKPQSPLQVSAEMVPVGILIVVVAWFMEIAVELQEESELTV